MRTEEFFDQISSIQVANQNVMIDEIREFNQEHVKLKPDFITCVCTRKMRVNHR